MSSSPPSPTTPKKRNLKGLALPNNSLKPGTSIQQNPNGSYGPKQVQPRKSKIHSITTTTSTSATTTPAAAAANGSLSSSSHSHSHSSSSSSSSSSSASARGGGNDSNPSSTSTSTPSSATTSSSNHQEETNHHPYLKFSDQLANLELGIEFKVDVKENSDLEVLKELGSGNGGTVFKVLHTPTKRIMARKVIHIDTKPAVRKQIIRELQIMHDCSSPYVVSFFGAFLHHNSHINIVMEFMDKGSLDTLYRRNGPIGEPILGKVCLSVLNGLTYLYDKHRIIHRDIKPSNILINSAGDSKLCDFGVSGEAAFNSIVDTFVGTQIYMSPERLQGSQYTTKGDSWSLGITLVEIGLSRFPFLTEELPPLEQTLTPATEEARRNSLRPPRLGTNPVNGGLAPFEMMMLIVNEPSPRLPADRFTQAAISFVDQCLQKEVDKRSTPKELLNTEWMIQSSTTEVNMATWAQSLK